MSVDEDDSMQEGFGELRADVRHIQSDVTDIKAEVRATNVRLDSERKELAASIQGSRSELAASIDKVRGDLTASIQEVRSDLTASIQEVRSDLTASIDKVRGDLTADIQGLRTDHGKKLDDLAGDLAKGLKDAATKTEELRQELTGKIDRVDGKIDDVKDSLANAKIWALLLYVGLAGSLFFVMAKGFKWL